MPIYDQSYRSYEGELRSRFRWATIVRQELRILLSRRMFIFLILLGNLHFILRVVQIYLLDVLSKQSNGPFADAMSGAEMENTGAWVYFDFLRIQSPLLFLILIYAGSGLINNDFKNNLVEIYFSKPINWRDYLAGKVATLVLVGMSLSTLPALFLGLVHVVFTPTMDAIRETLALAIPTIGFSFLLSLTFALTILAASSIINSSRFAGISILMLTLVNITFSALLALLSQQQDLLALAFPVNLNNLGEIMFRESRYDNPVEVGWPSSAVYVAIVCGLSLLLIARKARSAEVGR